MTQEQLEVVNRVLRATFPGIPPAVLDEGRITVGDWSVAPLEVEANGARLSGLAVDVAVGDYDGSTGITSVHPARVAATSTLAEAVRLLAVEIAKRRADVALDDLATESMVRQMEAENEP